MKNISAWAIRHPITPMVLFVVLFFLGVVAFVRLPINSESGYLVSAGERATSRSPARRPAKWRRRSRRKVEGSISNIGNVRNITTYIVEGTVNIFLEFQIGTPIDRAVTDVRDAVAKVRNDLPQGIMEPLVQRESVDGGAISYYAVTTTSFTPQELSWFIDNTSPSGCSPCPESRKCRAAAASTGRFAWSSIRRACRRSVSRRSRSTSNCGTLNLDAAGGRAQVGGGEQAIRVLGGAKSAEDLADTQIITSGGRSVRLREIADVRDGVAEVRTLARLNGRPAVAFGVFKAKGASDVSVSKAGAGGARQDSRRDAGSAHDPHLHDGRSHAADL